MTVVGDNKTNAKRGNCFSFFDKNGSFLSMSHIHGPMGERLRRRIVAAAFIKLSRFWTKLNEYFERRRGDKKALNVLPGVKQA